MRSSMRLWSAVICTALVTIAGCLFPSLDSLTNGDGGDAALEGSSADAATDAGAVPFCSTVDATFCEDFDDISGNTFPKWDSLEVNPGGTLVRVDAGLSAPNAIAIAYPATSSNAQVAEELGIQLLPTANTIHFVYDIIADQLDTTSGSYMELTALDITSNNNLLSVREELASTGIRLTAGVYPSGGGSTFPFMGNVVALDVGTWHHVDVLIDLTQTPATGSFSMDGKPHAVDAGIPGATFGPGTVAATGGVYYATFPTTGWQVRMDNFAIWIQ